MLYPKIPLAQSVLEICRIKNIQNIVISPGSRNAPLTIGFTKNSFFKCYSIVDERCAAFFALGLAQQLQEPVAVVCTSGSALLNYYPAFAEAFYSQIPLIVLSADRPRNKIDIGDGQTIRQENVFANHSLHNANLTDVTCKENDYKMQEAIAICIAKKGPVHINIPFEEPLYETVNETSIPTEIYNFEQPEVVFPSLNEFADTWNLATKKLVLIGSNYPNSIPSEYLNFLANDPSVVVMTEVTSNVHHSLFISNIDAIITPFSSVDFLNFKPDILLTFGGMLVSKRIKSFLRSYKPNEHWHIDILRAYNTFDCLTHHFELEPSSFFEKFIPLTTTISSNYRDLFLTIKKERKIHHFRYLENIPFSDLKVFDLILRYLPTTCMLQISNSSAIRYAQLFSIFSTIPVFCNRGTSGIDGCTSVAIGASVGNKKQTVLITGDISFFYDSNALWNNYILDNFKIILINNSGGGIFRILPGFQENETFTTYFETKHQLTAKQLSEMYQLDYISTDNETNLAMQLPTFFESKKPSLLEIFTPATINDMVLLNYFKEMN